MLINECLKKRGDTIITTRSLVENQLPMMTNSAFSTVTVLFVIKKLTQACTSVVITKRISAFDGLVLRT
jgi:hypothetical protein